MCIYGGHMCTKYEISVSNHVPGRGVHRCRWLRKSRIPKRHCPNNWHNVQIDTRCHFNSYTKAYKSEYFFKKGKLYVVNSAQAGTKLRNQGGGSAHDFLQAHELFQKIYHKSMFFRQIGILFNTFCFYPDLQQLHSKTMFISSSKSHYKLRYKG